MKKVSVGFSGGVTSAERRTSARWGRPKKVTSRFLVPVYGAAPLRGEVGRPQGDGRQTPERRQREIGPLTEALLLSGLPPLPGDDHPRPVQKVGEDLPLTVEGGGGARTFSARAAVDDRQLARFAHVTSLGFLDAQTKVPLEECLFVLHLGDRPRGVDMSYRPARAADRLARSRRL